MKAQVKAERSVVSIFLTTSNIVSFRLAVPWQRRWDPVREKKGSDLCRVGARDFFSHLLGNDCARVHEWRERHIRSR